MAGSSEALPPANKVTEEGVLGSHKKLDGAGRVDCWVPEDSPVPLA